jgi:peptide-methionine (S)-S-oxide reductase
MRKVFAIFVSLLILSASSLMAQKDKTPFVSHEDLSKFSLATFSSGCFWCMEGVYESVKGVHEVISGYSGGKENNPTYEKVGTETTGHAETVQVYYDPKIVSYETLLKVYFASQDPTQANGQGPDHGPSYRSIIFYRNDLEKQQALAYKAVIQSKYTKKVAAEIVPFVKFWPAETYHQDYIKHHPEVEYVQMESIPRIKRFQKQYPELIKPDHKL